MKNVANELEEFLKKASSAELAQNWEDLKEFSEIGPDAQVFIEQLEEFNHSWNAIPDKVAFKEISNPEFSLDFLFLAS